MLNLLVLQVPLVLIPFVPPQAPCLLEVLPLAVVEERMLVDFTASVQHYVRVHRRLERTLPPEHMFADEDMSLAIDELHEAIVATRPNAREGGMFTPPVAAVIAARLRRAIADNGYTADEVLAAINVGYLPGMPEPEINGRFPLERDIQVWPRLLAVLPALPEELEYRFANRDLVLVDMHADLVVDILRDALPAARDR